MMAGEPFERLTSFVHNELELLLRELHDIRISVYERRYAEAHDAMSRWWRRLARHLDWAERALLPAYSHSHAAGDPRALEHHADDRRELAHTAVELLECLEKRGCTQEALGLARLDRLRMRLIAHRDHELNGVCAVLDETLSPAAIRRLEREHAL